MAAVTICSDFGAQKNKAWHSSKVMLKILQARLQQGKVWSLGWEDPLEKEMATHSSIPAWQILWTEESGRLQSMGSQNNQTQLSN